MIRYSYLFSLFIISGLLICCKTQLISASADIVEVTTEIDSSQYYRVELGRELFHDPILSRDSTVSCATCHKQELAFTDGLPQAIGIKERVGRRNSPTLTNVGNRPYLLLDGVNPSLESQVGAPIQEHAEFDFHILLIVDRLNANETYKKLANKAYNRDFNEYVVKSSIAEFERTLISDDSPYDRFLKGDESALTEAQIRGKNLFFNTLYCTECHNGTDLTNDRLTNNGLYEVYEDDGRMRLTEKEEDRAIFKVPTLRNIALTAPYMHDGSMVNLNEVLAHYMSGGIAHPGKGSEIEPFELSEQEQSDLISFFDALTDETFINNNNFDPK